MNQRGISLIEVLISAFLVAMISLIAAQILVDQKKAQKQLVFIDLKKELVEEIESELSGYRRCTELLRLSLNNPLNFPTNFNQRVSETIYDEQFYHPALKIEEAALQYDLAPNTDSQQEGGLKTYKGYMDLKITPRADSLTETMIQLKNIRVPITILDKAGKGRWSDIVCANSNTETNSLISEACAYYGGTLVDGTHCDFGRFMRRHQDLGASAVPVVNVNDTSIQDGKPRANRIQLSDLMCYLDTLTTMIPDVRYQQRDPNLDSYKENRYTMFCKRPGKVSQAPRVDFNSVIKTMSKDIRDLGYFTEVQNGN